MAYKLILLGNGRREERALEGPSVSLGRDSANHVVIDPKDRSVSRFHARLDFDGQHWKVVDTRSRNHVRVNGSLIEPDEAGGRVLVDGDAILLGGFDLRFVRDEDERVVLADDARAAGMTQRVTAPARMEDLTELIQAPAAVPFPKEAEEAIERAKKAVTVLSTVAHRIAALTPEADIIDAIIALVFEATPAERAALLLWDADAGRLIPKRARTRAGGEAPTISVSESLVRQAFLDKAVVEMDPKINLSASMIDLRLRSAVAVPLLGESNAVGVIYADTSLARGAFDPFGVALLSALAGQAAVALEQTRLLRSARQEERKRWKLEQYLAPGVVNRILSSGESSPGFVMKAEEVEISVLFCDMAGFTSRTEDMPPQDVLVLLNRCFSDMTEIIQEHGGTVDKYIGDCIMAVFGAPFAQPDHARRASLAALGIRAAIEKMNAGSEVPVGFRIGIHSGRAVAGDVGHVTRRNWTVIGSTVNLAARMESSVALPGQIVLTGVTRAGLGDDFVLRPVDVVTLPKGIKHGFEAFELLGVQAR